MRGVNIKSHAKNQRATSPITYVKKLLICSKVCRFFAGIKSENITFFEYFNIIIYGIRQTQLMKNSLLWYNEHTTSNTMNVNHQNQK